MRNSFLPALLSLLVAGSTYATEVEHHDHDHDHDHHHPHTHADYEVFLPAENGRGALQLLTVQQLPSADLWREFELRHGDWSILLDPATHNPRQAIGKPAAIEGISEINSSNIEFAALRFLQTHAQLFNTNPDQLEFVRATPIGEGAGRRWYVSLRQQFDDLDVLFSEVELRINSRAEVFAFRLNTFPDLELQTQASLSQSAALTAAIEGLSVANQKEISFHADAESVKLKILPIVDEQKVAYHLVYAIDVYSNHPGHRYKTLVDAHTGTLLQRQAQCCQVATNLKVNADVRTGLRNEAIETVPLQSLELQVDGQTYLTDANGEVSIELSDDSELQLALSGPYITVEAQGRQNSRPTFSLKPGEDQTLTLEDGNTHLFERNMFYHGNVVYNWHKQVDPTSEAMDLQLVIQLWYEGGPFGGGNGQPNAFSNRDTIAFLGLSNTTMVMADGGSVLYHEYGHSINTIFAENLGGTFNNRATQEGIADAVAAFIEDQPQVGLGVFTNNPTRAIRNAENTLKYPDDVQGDSHADGQIISGAFWDLRKLTDLETATRLLHFARYGLPDDADNGIAWGEWFMEVLIADDDDGDLTNGTPHCDEIVEAFDLHNIGAGLFLQTSFTHQALPDTDETREDYQLTYKYNSLSIKSGATYTSIVEYWTNSDPQRRTLLATGNETAGFAAAIPAQPRGTLVNYSIYRVNTQDDKVLISGPGAIDGVYTFLVGYDVIVAQDFENSLNWTLGVNSDLEAAARWEIADPERIYLPDLEIPVDLLVQPEDDHSAVGVQCLVTGARRPQFDFTEAMVSNGRTTAISPAYDLVNVDVPIIQCYHYFTKLTAPIPGAPQPEFRIEISGNDGADWQELLVTSDATEGWSKLQAVVPAAMENSSALRLRFIVEAGEGGFALGNALVDDLRILGLPSSVSTDVEVIAPAMLTFTLAPNPAKEACALSFELLRNAELELNVVDLFGQSVYRWTPGLVAAGTHRHAWNIEADGAVAAGTYFVQLTIDDQTFSRQLQVR